LLRREEGAGTIIEYTVVFPIVLVMVGMLLIAGFGVYQRGVLEGAAERQAIYAARQLSVPGYNDMVVFDAGDGAGVSAVSFGEGAGVGATGLHVYMSQQENNPYRNLGALITGGGDVGGAADKLAAAIENGTLPPSKHMFETSGDPSVEAQGRIFRSALATAQQDLVVPLQYSWIRLPELLEIPVSAEYPALESAELIRNLQMVEDYYHASKLDQWVDQKLGQLQALIGIVEDSDPS
jgi:hypothetical protein